MAERYDVIVIGNGAVGLSIAHRLKARAPELRLAVIGERARPGGATPAAGAMLNAWGDLVRDQFADPVLVDRAALMIDALALWEPFCEDLSPFAAVKPGWGTLVLETGRGGASESQTLATVVGALEARGVSAPRHPRGRLIPDGWIDGPRFLAALDAAVRARDVTLVDDVAVTLAPASASWSVQTRDGAALNAERVVLANGPFAQVLIDQIEDVRRATPRLAYEAGAGFDVVFRGAPPVPFVARTLGRGAIGGFHIVPLQPERFYVGATAEAALEPDWVLPERRLASVRKAFVEEYDPAFGAAQFTPGPLGFRALSADGFPLLGESHMRGLWFATGMRRDGLTSCPVIAGDIAAAMLDGNISASLRRFPPSRAPLSYKTRSEALADAAAGHAPEEQARLAALYDALDVGAFGVSPSILPLLADAKARAMLAIGAG
jgi:glycine/D-amino acid oxidase-like deaminating enzyme